MSIYMQHMSLLPSMMWPEMLHIYKMKTMPDDSDMTMVAQLHKLLLAIQSNQLHLI